MSSLSDRDDFLGISFRFLRRIAKERNEGNVQDETLMALCEDYASAEEIPLDAGHARVNTENAEAGFA